LLHKDKRQFRILLNTTRLRYLQNMD